MEATLNPYGSSQASPQDARPTKLCFVTIGATAGFNALVREVLAAPFFEALQAHGYTDLMVQHGSSSEKLFTEWKAANGLAVEQTYGVYVTGFPYNLRGLSEEFRAVKRDERVRREEGVVISHAGAYVDVLREVYADAMAAGTGTILEALRYGIPLVVVPNPDLMHNHQEELAKQLETVGWVIHGKIG